MNRKTLSLKMNYEMLVSYFALYLPDGFIIETPIEKDISEIANIQHQSFVSGISYEMFGVDCLEDIVDSLKQSFYRYIGTDPNLYSDNVTIIFTNFIFHNIT
ncbi:MAG TPA: hypothetical protein VN258_04485 [Mobilitalea sp.]|nr:hypothetical protein [Mobilitalea sp.]